MLGDAWLEAVWPVVRDLLPAAPARVVDLGCGSLGGFVPALRAAGYDAVGVDPKAPAGDDYRRAAFEEVELEGVDAVIASLSLHHVHDPAAILDRIAASLRTGGSVVMIEWDWELFDEHAAQWCFERLGGQDGWLRRRRDHWAASGQAWSTFLRDWAERDRINSAAALLELLDERFERKHLVRGPYYFTELDVSEADERAAIEANELRAARVEYAGTLR